VFQHLSAKFGKLKTMSNVIPISGGEATAVRLRSALQAYLAGEAVLQGRPERIMKLAVALLAARIEHSDNTGFSVWLASEGLDNLGGDDRAALLNMAKYPDLSWQVLQKTDRISVRLIWEEDIKPLIPRQAAIAIAIHGETLPATAETLRVQASSQRCEDGNEAPSCEKTQENQGDMSVLADQAEGKLRSDEGKIAPPPAPAEQTVQAEKPVAAVAARGITAQAGYYGMPRAEEIMALFLNKNARTVVSSAMKESAAAKKEIWSLILTCADAGLLRQVNYSPATTGRKLPLRLFLSDLPETLSRDYDLTVPAVRKEVRTIILPAVLDQKHAFLKDPASLKRLVNTWRIKKHAELAAEQHASPHTPPVVTPPDFRPVIVMYGVQLWPIVESRFGSYDYDQLRTAIWTFQEINLLLEMTSDKSPKSRAIRTRFSTRYYSRYAERALDSENGQRMREVFSLVHVLANLLETNPDGECTPPVAPHGNLGWD